MSLKKEKALKEASYKKGVRSDILQMDTMMIPGAILIFIFNYLPMIGIIIAFKRYNPNLGIFASEWVGLDNFKFFFQSRDFAVLMRNTLLYSLWFIIADNFCNILLAILFYNVRKRGALKYYQTTSILPTFMSTVLVSYVVYSFLSPSSGVINSVLRMMGTDIVNWYTEPKYWPVILTIVKQWMGVGYGSLIYYATMVGIDESLFEAAEIDGANKFRQVIHIIIPEIMGLLCLKIVMGVGHAMGGDFGLFYQIPRNIGLLYPTTDILNTYTFRALQEGSSMGRTAAVGLFQSLAGIVLLLITNGIIRKIDEDKSMF